VHFFNFDHLRIILQSSDLFWGKKFRTPSLLLPPLIFSYLQALIHGFLWWWDSSWLIFSLKWRLLSTLLLLHSAAIKIQKAKDSIDEEDPRPRSSNGATSNTHITAGKEASVTIENSRSDEKLLSVFHEGVKYGVGIGPGIYDIHSPRIPLTEEIAYKINKMLAMLKNNILWVNPDCGLMTCKHTEVKLALTNMVVVAKLIRNELAKWMV